jgi:hypothetical protein
MAEFEDQDFKKNPVRFLAPVQTSSTCRNGTVGGQDVSGTG